MFPLEKSEFIKIPTLHLQASIFHWRENLDALQFMTNQPEAHSESSFVLIKDTRHSDITDFGLIHPRVFKTLKMVGQSPLETHTILDDLICSFINGHITLPTLQQQLNIQNKRVVYGEEALKILNSSIK